MHFPLVSGLPYVVLLCSDPRIPTAFCPEHRNRRAEVGSETLSSYLSAIAPGIFEGLCSSHTQEDAALGNKNTVNICVHIGAKRMEERKQGFPPTASHHQMGFDPTLSTLGNHCILSYVLNLYLPAFVLILHGAL